MADQQAPAISVTAVIAKSINTTKSVTFSGPLVGREEIPVYASVAQGKVLKVLIDEDQRVRAGAVMATLDDSLFQAQRAQQQALHQRAVAALAQQEASLEEAQTLHNSG